MNDYGPLFSGEVLRDQGIAQITDHNQDWMEEAFMLSRGFVNRNYFETFTGEDIRFNCENFMRFNNPKHSNAWGALIKKLIGQKIIEPTGEYRKMKHKAAHARVNPVYRACAGG